MSSPATLICCWLFGWVRAMKPWCGSSVMVSEPETVKSMVPLSQQSGATAVVTEEAQVPMIATAPSTSISLRAARTAASGAVWSSSETSVISRPSTPPAAFTSATTPATASRIGGP